MYDKLFFLQLSPKVCYLLIRRMPEFRAISQYHTIANLDGNANIAKETSSGVF